MGDEVVAYFFDIRVIDNLDTAFFQLAGIRRNVRQIIGNKGDPVAELLSEELEDLEHPQRS